MGAMVAALGFAVLFQFIILRIKFNRKMYADIGVDIGMLVLLNIIFGGSMLGVVSATAGSTLISLYLIWKPVTLPTINEVFEGSPLEQPTDGNQSEKKNEFAVKSMRDKIDSLFD